MPEETKQQERLFRRAALDRLSSPEQLDQLMRVTTPRGWLALAGFGLLLLVAFVWSLAGSLPTRIDGQGILLKSGGLFDIVSLGSGQLTEVIVEVGGSVDRGQVVARVAQPELLDQRQKAEARLEELRQQHGRVTGFGSEEARLKAAHMAGRRENLRRSMGSARERQKWLEEKLQSQERLVEKGLITRQTLIATRQQHDQTRQELGALEAELQRLTVEEAELKNQHEQDVEASRTRVNEAERALDLLRQRLEMTTQVVSPHAGRVVEVRADVGNLIEPGTPILNLELRGSDLGDLQAILYVPPSVGKSVRPGMQVQISPSTVKREEYGFLVGTVSSVADYPASQRGMMRLLENEQLVETFLRSSGGAPIPVVAELRRDPTTPSGYQWSSPQGPPTQIFSGTLCSGRITIREQRPLSLLVPFLRGTLGV